MKLDNKKIFKEFLRLKWQEIFKFFKITILPAIAFVYIWLVWMLPWADKANNKEYPYTHKLGVYELFDYFASAFILAVGVSLLLGLIFIIYEWIKSNWKQAIKNIYSKPKKKTKRKKK